MRRPGLLIAVVFAAGAFLGLAASSLFLDIQSLDLRAAAEAQLAERTGPLASVAMDAVAEGGVFEGAADEVRARQIRNLTVAAAIASVGAVALGLAFARRSVPTPAPARASVPNHSRSAVPAWHQDTRAPVGGRTR